MLKDNEHQNQINPMKSNKGVQRAEEHLQASGMGLLLHLRPLVIKASVFLFSFFLSGE